MDDHVRDYSYFSPTCSRVVMDTNCFRGSSLAEMERVALRGFKLSVSVEAFREAWARSIREGEFELFTSRVRKISEIVDPEAPIAFIAGPLFMEIGSVAPNEVQDYVGFRTRVLSAWNALASVGMSDEQWRTDGEQLNAALTELEDAWIETVEKLQKLEKQQRAIGYPKARARKIYWRGVVDGLPVTTRPHKLERASAYFHYFVAKMADIPGRTPTRNDASDALHLFHLAWPAFLMTADTRLIETVDRTGTFQRVWVRTPVELAEDTIARSAPWGKPSRLISENFLARDRATLNHRLLTWRQELRDGK